MEFSNKFFVVIIHLTIYWDIQDFKPQSQGVQTLTTTRTSGAGAGHSYDAIRRGQGRWSSGYVSEGICKAKNALETGNWAFGMLGFGKLQSLLGRSGAAGKGHKILSLLLYLSVSFSIFMS